MTQHGEKCGDLGGHYVTLKKIWAPFTLASRGSNEKTAIIKKTCLPASKRRDASLFAPHTPQDSKDSLPMIHAPNRLKYRDVTKSERLDVVQIDSKSLLEEQVASILDNKFSWSQSKLQLSHVFALLFDSSSLWSTGTHNAPTFFKSASNGFKMI